MKLSDLETVAGISERLKSLKAMKDAIECTRRFGEREGVRLRLVMSNVAPEECMLDMADAKEILNSQIAKLKNRLEALGVVA